MVDKRSSSTTRDPPSTGGTPIAATTTRHYWPPSLARLRPKCQAWLSTGSKLIWHVTRHVRNTGQARRCAAVLLAEAGTRGRSVSESPIEEDPFSVPWYLSQ